MINNKLRIGRFTSSQIYRLMKNARNKVDPGAPFFTYVEEIVAEKRLGRSLDTGAYSQAMAWGRFMENVIFNHLGLEWSISSKTTAEHPTMGHIWSGSVDLLVESVKVGEIKCYEPKKFTAFVDMLKKKDVALFKKDFEQEYWQIVSNAIIHKVQKGEVIAFMPYDIEMDSIRKLAEDYEGSDKWQYRFITEKQNYELPVLPHGGYYENINLFEFTIPTADKMALTARVKMAEAEVERIMKNDPIK